ncbi:MAG TPA: HIT domain-containing protein, partial [Pseudonocardia sp.]
MSDAALPGATDGPVEPVAELQDGVGTPDGFRRLWTPHRLAYIKDAGGDGCPFCRIPGLPDEEGLVVARGHTVYAVLNLHPYNPGHLMVLPYRHVAELEDLTADEAVELMTFTRAAVQALKQVAAPHA